MATRQSAAFIVDHVEGGPPALGGPAAAPAELIIGRLLPDFGLTAD
jgi:hypothetical protein